MRNPSKRRFWNIHLSTIIVLLLSIGVLLVLNTFSREWHHGPTIYFVNSSSGSTNYYYGWPSYFKIEHHSQPFLPAAVQWYPDALRNNIIAGILILSMIGLVFELVRRQWAVLLDCRPRLRPSVLGFIFAVTAVLWLNLREGYHGDYMYGWPGSHVYIDSHGFGEDWNFRQLAWNLLAAASCIAISVYSANRLTRELPSRPFQYHLLTFLLLSAGTSGYLLLNLPSEGGWYTASYGWPFVMHKGMFVGLYGDFVRIWLPRLGIALNLLIYVLGAMSFISLCEFVIHCFEAKKT